jgi:hypothetical protein
MKPWSGARVVLAVLVSILFVVTLVSVALASDVPTTSAPAVATRVITTSPQTSVPLITTAMKTPAPPAETTTVLSPSQATP